MTVSADIFLCFTLHKLNHCPNDMTGNDSHLQSQLPCCFKPEEVLNWGQSFKSLLSSEAGRDLFKQFLTKEHSQENILFYEACEELSRLQNDDEIFEKVRSIYDSYISTESLQEVSLDSQTRDEIQEKMINPDKDIFKHAVEHIHELMYRDCYPRFKNSDLYKSALEQSRADNEL